MGADNKRAAEEADGEMGMDLTEKEQEVYDAIVDYMMHYGFAPSVRDICDMTGLRSTSSVHHYMMGLNAKKMIKTYGSPRAIKLIGYKLVKETKDARCTTGGRNLKSNSRYA